MISKVASKPEQVQDQSTAEVNKMTNIPKDKHEENIPVDQLSFEQAHTELQTIVGELESEGLSLDEALAFFERGQELIHYCSNLLDQTELKVQQILGEEIIDFETQVE